MAGKYQVEWYDTKVLREAEWVVDEVERASARRVRSGAKRRVPVLSISEERDAPEGGKSWQERRSGALKDSIEMHKSKYKHGGYIVMAGDYDTFYASFVELGTPDIMMYLRHKRYKHRVTLRIPQEGKRFLRGPLEQERRIFRRRIKEIFTE